MHLPKIREGHGIRLVFASLPGGHNKYFHDAYINVGKEQSVVENDVLSWRFQANEQTL